MDAFIRTIIQRTLSALPELVSRYGLHPEAAVRYSLIREVWRAQGRKAPGIVSGFRSPQQQRCLLENWRAGRRVNTGCGMPVSQPACRSRHTTTLLGQPAATALDISMSNPDWREFARIWASLPYARTGESFGDPNHLYVTIPGTQPRDICS